MKFLFTVQGEGRGHMTQALALRQSLTANGHEVVAVLVGKNPQRKIPDFFYNKIQAPTFAFESPNFLMDKNQRGVKTFKSIIYSCQHFGRYAASLKFMRAKIKEYKPDVIINFYEPLTGLLYVLFHPNIPLACIGHQYFSQHPHFKFPARKPISYFLFRTYTNLTCYGASAKLALSFKAWEDLPHKGLFIVPPLLRQEVLESEATDGNFLLIYLLNAGYAPDIISWHQEHSQQKIVIFCDQKNPDWPEDENLVFNAINDENFLKHLRECCGYLSTAGFESICEASYLGKPVFVVPTYKHFEQECNAIDIVKSGLGLTGSKFRISDFITYLHNQKGSARADFKNWEKLSPKKIINILESLQQDFE